MSTDAEVLAQIDAEFGPLLKPEHFTNFTHCEECAEHDETLRTCDRETLEVRHVGNAGWDPLAFSSPHGKAYYMPTLARFALAAPTYEFGWYGDQLLFHLFCNGAENKFLKFCNVQQRRAVAGLLAHFMQTGAFEQQRLTSDEELKQTYELWANAV